MNEKQRAEWNAAQKISIGEDLIAAAQKQLEFLAAVDRQRWLYSSPGVETAIYRYKNCWLPLLAKHSENGDLEHPLVVPLDCEWIWHCHRLNPVQYKRDCERVYGRILDCKNVESSLRAESKNLSSKIWDEMYPSEPFELNYSEISSQKYVDANAEDPETTITYDLVAAVQRQSSFYYQVSRPFTQDPRFLAEALARYKGFLYLIKRNQVNSLQQATVPTYDIDIMWHSHQLRPVSYCKDQTALLGQVLQHDDTDSDRSVGKKLHDGFTETTKQFEETFGLRYWRAGAMYRGLAPTPLTIVPLAFDTGLKGEKVSLKYCESSPSLAPPSTVEVFLEIVDVKGVEKHEPGTLYVSFNKKQPDPYFSGDRTVRILSLTRKKNVECFQCEPTGDLTLTLLSESNQNSQTVLGTTSISLEELTSPNSKLLTEEWFQLSHKSSVSSKTTSICLLVAVSSTPPLPSSLILTMVRSSDESGLPSILLPVHLDDNSANNYLTSFVDAFGNPIIWVQIRDVDVRQKNMMIPEKEVVAVTKLSRTPIVLAVSRGNEWSFTEASNISGTAEIKACEDGTYHCEFKGDRVVKLYWGKKLEYEEQMCCESHNHDCASITAVEFSDRYPYGKAIATFDMISKVVKVNEEWFIHPWTTLSLVFMDMKESITTKYSNMEIKNACAPHHMKSISKSSACGATCGTKCQPACLNSQSVGKSSACGATCGTKCQPACLNGQSVGKSSACGATCGTKCQPACLTGQSVKSSACGATCGTKCQPACLTGQSVKSSACGATCGTKCQPACLTGQTVSKSSACGATCGTKCQPACLTGQSVSKSSACGATCGTKCQPACLTGNCAPHKMKSVSKGSACGATCGTKCQPACLTGK